MRDDDLERLLEQRAARGDARGPHDVWESAQRDARRPGRRPLRGTVLALAASFVAVATVAWAVAIDSDDPPHESATTSAPDGGSAERVVAQNASSLVVFDDCASVLEDLKAEALERVGPYGLDGPQLHLFGRRDFEEQGGGVPFGALDPGSTSATNTQEVGIDEPDLVETDGRRLFDVRGGTLRVVDVESARLTATVPLGLVDVLGAVLVDDVLVVFANELLIGGLQGEAKVVLVDVTGDPEVRERLTVDGTLVDARVVQGRVHVVFASAPTIAFTYPQASDDGAEERATAANKERIRQSTLADWLPSATVTDGDGGNVERRDQLAACDEIHRPRAFAGFEQTTLTTLDLDDLAASRGTSVQAASLLVYGTDRSVYTATTEYQDLEAVSARTRPVSAEPHTDLHRFELGAEPAYAGAGRVDGFVGQQFGMSEHAGHLRVASSTFEGGAESRVSVLRVDEGELVGTGVVTGIGPDEGIEGIRFIGDLGYVITFRRTDPLYVIDLHDPAAPRVAGELEIPGYSSYLHPVGEGLLLGVGHDGTDDGFLTGAAVSLFDVRDPGLPARIDLERLGRAATPHVDEDHHAFLWWEETSTAYVPIGVAGRGGRVDVLRLVDGALERVGEVVPAIDAIELPNLDRVVIVGERLLSVGPAGVQISDLATLAPLDWVAYR